MTLWRVSYRGDMERDSTDEHQGYSFHASRKEAVASAKADNEHARIERVTVRATKAGILAALNDYATHPNNG